MADITFFDALGEGGLAISFFDQASLAITSHTRKTATMTDVNGAKVKFTGFGLSLTGDQITGGTITGIKLIAASGDVLTTVTGLHRSAASLWNTFHNDGLFSAELALISGNDTIHGSSMGDFMIGLTGNDLMFGGGGDDGFLGGKGRDTMKGGAGGDVFSFSASDGKAADVILDFHATGDATVHDHIAVSQAAYDHMTVTQVGVDTTVIHWDWGGALTLRHVLASDLDITDFSLG